MTEGVYPDIAAPTEAAAPLPVARPSLLPLRVDQANVVAEAGQAVLIWFALFSVYGSQHMVSYADLLGITIAAAVWLVALRCAVMPGRAVLGNGVAASVGTSAGLVVVTALNSSIVGLHVSYPLLVSLGFAVFSSVTVWRWFVDRTLAARRRVLLVGAEGVENLVAEELRTTRQRRFDLVGAVAGAEELAEIVEAQRPDLVVLTDETTYGPALERLLDARAQVRVAGVENFFEYAFGRVPIELITPAWFMSLLHPRQHIYTRFSKRTFDVVFSTLGLVLAAPVLAALALVTKTTPGPILHRQTRIGEGGRTFTIYKFRTMRDDAEHGGPAFSDRNDPRVTGIGRMLRRTHLDELPQLWNVLSGEMSIVGPRPERPEFIEMIEAVVPFWNRRLLVKPGITGWAQVRCGYASDCEEMEKKLSYDLWYLRNRGVLVDLAVCVMTLFAVLARPVKS
jgi:exopolysaccharide biosynthesis polyprenyl glycosylphosphotransferase